MESFTVHRSAFTLVEMIVVISVIVVLAGLVAPAAYGLLGSSQRDGTEIVMKAITSQMTTSDSHVIRLSNGKYVQRWDVNDDGYLDGLVDYDLLQGSHAPSPTDPLPDPAIDESLQEQLKPTGYRGTLDDLALPLDPNQYVNELNGRIKDAYGNELQIVFGESYGSTGLGIISPGPDGVTDPDVTGDKRTYDPEKAECADDIVSW